HGQPGRILRYRGCHSSSPSPHSMGFGESRAFPALASLLIRLVLHHAHKSSRGNDHRAKLPQQSHEVDFPATVIGGPNTNEMVSGRAKDSPRVTNFVKRWKHHHHRTDYRCNADNFPLLLVHTHFPMLICLPYTSQCPIKIG